MVMRDCPLIRIQESLKKLQDAYTQHNVLNNLSNALLRRIILHGDERLSVDSNSGILKETLRCLYATQRFE